MKLRRPDGRAIRDSGVALRIPPENFQAIPYWVLLSQKRYANSFPPYPLTPESSPMKSSEDWAVEIIAYMQKNPVTTFLAAKDQIKHVVELVQKDAAISDC